MEQIARENFEMWNSALLTKNPQKVAELYTPDATFLPTMSGDFKLGQSGVEEYFKHFLLKNPFGKILEDKIQVIGQMCYLHSGLYNFEVDGENNREVVEARFTFVWQKNEKEEWKILHHHSSLKP